MPRLLELFAGTGSIGRAFRDRGWGVVSLDNDPKSNPTICADILKWDYAAYPKDHFCFIWASPLCTYYSIARSTRKSTEAELAYADSLVQKTREITSYFGCPWAFENPQTGRLKTRPIVADLPFEDVTYCKYGTSYKKRTRIWNSLGDAWRPKPICEKGSRCEHFTNGCHPATAQKGPCRNDAKRIGDTYTQRQLYHIPAALCDELALAAESAIRENANVHEEGASVEPDAQKDLRGN
jgi:hypothetical protein